MLRTDQIASHPEEVGVDSERLEALFARARRDVDDGVLPSAQVAVARQGKLAAVRTFGTAVQNGAEKPATDDTLYCVYSTTKGVMAVAAWILLEQDLLRLDEPVAGIVPEFGTNGKDVISVAQLLTHTGGFPYAPLGPERWNDRDKRLEAFSRWRLNWEPGSRFEYHPTSAHWVLAEIIERRTEMDHREFARRYVTAPMGVDELFVGLPPEFDCRVAEVRQMVPPVEPPGGWGQVTPDALLVFNEPENRRIGVPGGGAVTGAAELAMLYQPLLNGGATAEGTRIVKEETIETATRVLTTDVHTDPVMRVPVNRAAGVVIAGDDGKGHLRGFGRAASAVAFGHGGAGGQVAWGDPKTGLSVGYCTNGFADWLGVARRTTAISTLAAQCVPME
jgi:CubicO group peptidase (beta-lactamase class C family)